MADRNPFYLEFTRCAFCDELGLGGQVRNQPRGVQPCGLGEKVYNNNGKFDGKFCTKLETIRRSAIGIRLPITSGGLYVCTASRHRNRRARVPTRPRTSPRRADDDPQSSQEPRGATAAVAAGVVVCRAKIGRTSVSKDGLDEDARLGEEPRSSMGSSSGEPWTDDEDVDMSGEL
jgi:hypothetical protein